MNTVLFANGTKVAFRNVEVSGMTVEQLANTKQTPAHQPTVCVHCDHLHARAEVCESGIAIDGDDLNPGQVINDKYKIEEEIGAGGMCVVYRATQTVIGKTVALKMLRSQYAVDQTMVQRFEQEATTLGRLRHPHAITVFDFGFTPQHRPYLVMDFIEGQTLSELLRREGPLPVPRINKLLSQICNALQAAMQKGSFIAISNPRIFLSQPLMVRIGGGTGCGVAKLQEENKPE